MVLVPPCHASSRRESPPYWRKIGKRYERPLQPAGWLFGHQEFPFHSPLPPGPRPRTHLTVDIKSSSGTSVFVSLLLLSFFVAALLTNERPVVSSFFENRLVLEIFGVGSNLTTL